MIVLLCAAVSGAMFYLSQGVDAVWSLAWIAPLPLLWLAYDEASQAPRWPLFLAGLFAFAVGQFYAIPVYGAAMWITVSVMILGGGAAFGAVLLLARRLRRTLPPLAALLGFPVLWTAFEYLVGWVSPHGSWGALGYSQVAFPPAIQIAAVFGVYAVTFLVCLFANALALAARGSRGTAWIGIGLSVACLLGGQFRLMLPQQAPVGVAMLSDWQGRLQATRRLDRDATHAMAAAYAHAAVNAARQGARLIVIPEGAMTVDPAWQWAALAPLADAARDTGATIVVGVTWVRPWRDTAIAFESSATRRIYDKRHLLPPFEDKFVPGTRPGLLGDGRAVVICKDMDFPRTLRADAIAAGSQGGLHLMAVPAGDFTGSGWGRGWGDGWIHARMAVMRGVENGFAVVRSAFKGLQTASDARGHVLARTSTVAPGMVVTVASVPPGPGPTLYTRIGDVFSWLCVATALALMAAMLRTRKPEN
jgi:apolipoprotein N-acyltransferase